jgi:hypothetical protein
MIFYKGVLFHEKRRNLIFYEKLRVDVIGYEVMMVFIKGSTSTIREDSS